MGNYFFILIGTSIWIGCGYHKIDGWNVWSASKYKSRKDAGDYESVRVRGSGFMWCGFPLDVKTLSSGGNHSAHFCLQEGSRAFARHHFWTIRKYLWGQYCIMTELTNNSKRCSHHTHTLAFPYEAHSTDTVLKDVQLTFKILNLQIMSTRSTPIWTPLKRYGTQVYATNF